MGYPELKNRFFLWSGEVNRVSNMQQVCLWMCERFGADIYSWGWTAAENTLCFGKTYRVTEELVRGLLMQPDRSEHSQ